jgi:hypothetical protein
MEINMEITQKTKNRFILSPYYIILGHESEGVQINIQEKYLYTHVYSSYVHNCQAMESG